MTAQVIHYDSRLPRRAVEDVTSGPRPRLFPLMFFVLGVVALFFAMIFLRISLDQAAFELETIETEIAFEESRQLDLRFDLAGLKDPLRIATEAQRIGLIYPDERVALSVPLLGAGAQTTVSDTPVRALTGDRP